MKPIIAVFLAFALTACRSSDANYAIEVTAPPEGQNPTLFLIGDSTVRNGTGDGAQGQWGWGEPLADRVNLAKAAVLDRARGGSSSRTFLADGLWDDVL